MIPPLIVELEFLLRILLSGICGCLIGYERDSRLKEAGMRTHLIVALTASMMMVVSKYGFSDVTTHCKASVFEFKIVFRLPRDNHTMALIAYLNENPKIKVIER